MEWQQIVGFYNVAKLESFTKAANATFRTQSAISQQIKNLEEELGCQLLERIGKRKLRLTSAGERFFKFSETVMQKYDSLVEELGEALDSQKGRLRIAAPFTTLYHLFPFALKSYVKLFPNVDLTILDRSQQNIIDHTINGEVDFGFVLESNVPKDLTSLRWHEVGTVLMTPKGHPLTKVKRVTLKQLGKYPLILPPINLKYRSNLEERFQKLGIDYRITMESSNVELSSLYVEKGFGISFATVVKGVPDLKKRRIAFLSLNHLFKPDYIALVMRKDKTLTSYKKAFIKILFQEVLGERLHSINF
jgi:DNA-binding transcriptional LysR family regulator